MASYYADLVDGGTVASSTTPDDKGNTFSIPTPTPTPIPAATSPVKLTTNQRIAQTIAAYAAENPPPAGTHYGQTLGPDGNPILYKNPANGIIPAGDIGTPGVLSGTTTNGVTGATTNPTTVGLTQAEVDAKIAAALASQQNQAAAQAKLDAQTATRTALGDFTAMLNGVGLGSLADTINTEILNGSNATEIQQKIRTTQAYADRFPGMKALSSKGQAINEAQYIALEQGYTETLHAYGLDTKTFASTSALGGYIGNQVSAREFEERVNDAATRVQAQPDVLSALQEFYNVDKAGATAYLLDSNKGMDVIRKQVRASEIGAAANAAESSSFNFGLNATGAEGLISQIGSEDLNTLKKEFGSAALLAQTQGRLASIEGQAYTSDTAIQASVVGNAQAILDSQRRAQREAARFGGSGGSISRVSTADLI